MAKKTEVTTIVTTAVSTEVVAFDAALLPAELQEELAREMEGLEMPPPPRIKVPAGGSLAFEVPTADESDPDMEKELRCIILAHHAVNRYYVRGLDEGGDNSPPDCISFDGKNGIIRETGECVECKTCPLNQYGSNPKGGKACSNRHRFYLLLEGRPMPYILEAPPTSLRTVGNYVARLIQYHHVGSTGVVTKIALKKEENKAGIKYSALAFSFGGILPAEVARAARVMGTEIEQRMKDVRYEVRETAADFAPVEEGEMEGVF
jgi:hypothetical protein